MRDKILEVALLAVGISFLATLLFSLIFLAVSFPALINDISTIFASM